MKVNAIIQARMGSSRLPGKVLMSLGGDTVLAQVVHRCRRARQLDNVIVATTTLPEDDLIVDECRRLGVTSIRGPAEDVLERYAMTIRQFPSDAVVRITSDCPLVDPGVIDEMVAQYRLLAHSGVRCDYLSNAIDRAFPRGLDVEVVRTSALTEAALEACAPHEREHVTPFIYLRPERYAVHTWRGDINASEHRWTLDTPEDHLMLSRVFDALGPAAADTPWREVLALVDRHPEWTQINRHIAQKSLTT